MTYKQLLIPFVCMSLIASASSCSDSEHEPLPGSGEMQTFNFTCQLSESVRSRGADENGMFGDASEVTKLRYGIYMLKDGALKKVISSSDETAPQAMYQDGEFNLSVSIKKEDANYYAYFFADAFGESVENPYAIDWETLSVSADLQKTYGLGEKADLLWGGVICYNKATGQSKTDITLIRSFTQVNVVSEELDQYDADGTDYSEYCLSVGLTNRDSGDRRWFPQTLYWDDEFIEFASLGSNEQIETTFESGEFPYVKLTKNDNRVTINGRTMRYLYSGYIINYGADDWCDNNDLFLRVGKTSDKVEKIIECKIPGEATNRRFFIYPEEGTTIYDDGKIVVTPSDEGNDSPTNFANFNAWWHLEEGQDNYD